jgi:ElaB/YqjD/DUF883 family membrane-anchored ribosome-binding protein
MANNTTTDQVNDVKDKIKDQVNQAASETSQAISEAANQAKERAAQFGQTVAQKVDEQRDAAAGALHNASETMHRHAERLPAGSEYVHSAAEGLDSVAGYMAEHDANEMMQDAGSFIKRHPGASVLVGVAAGFLLGRMIWRD